MAASFRSSLFGFHKEDVLKYIEHSTAKHTQEVSKLQKELLHQSEESKKLQNKLDEYKLKEQEMEQLSLAIGRLYLIAKSSSEKMIRDAKENLELSQMEKEKNLQGIEAVQQQLQALYEQLYASGSAFGEELGRLTSGLLETKQIISEKDADIQKNDTILNDLIHESIGAK